MVLTKSNQKLEIGGSAPNFSLRDVSNKNYSLLVFKDKPLLVIFMCNHCPYVIEKIDIMVNLHEKFKGKINVVGINSNDPNYEGEGFENMKRFAKKNKIDFPYLIDETQEIAKEYGAVCTPDPFLFDAKHKLVFHGMLDDSTEDIINRLLSDEKIDDSFKPSIGCSIKWK